jgi:hypothetical protein
LHAHRLSTSFLVIAVVWLALIGAEQLLVHATAATGGARLVRPALVAGLALAAAALIWRVRGALFAVVTSVPFGVALLCVLMGVTMLGTFVVQGVAPAEYRERFGAAAPLVLGLGLDDVFHSAWFVGLLALLAASLVLVAIKRAAWRPAMWGHLLCHMGVVVILCGGAIGNLFGYRGWIELHEGQSTDVAQTTARGAPTGESRALGFTIALDDFAMENYAAEERLVVYEPSGDDFRLASSNLPSEARDWVQVAGGEAAFRVLEVRDGSTVQVEVRDGGTERKYFLSAKDPQPLWLAHRTRALLFEPRRDDVKTYKSHLSVVESGRKVRSQVVEVNAPLVWRGYHFYQSSYRRDDPTWAGLEVVRDPGFSAVFTGFAMVGLGVIFLYYVRPYLRKRGVL